MKKTHRSVASIAAALLVMSAALWAAHTGATGAWMRTGVQGQWDMVGAHLQIEKQILENDQALTPREDGGYALRAGVEYTARAEFYGTARTGYTVLFGGDDQFLLTVGEPAVTFTPEAAAVYYFVTGWGEAEPVIPETEPTEPEPAETEPTETEPTETEPTEPEPAETEPTEPEPTETEPTEPEPTETEPTEPDPTETEPAVTVPETEPIETEAPTEP